MRIIKYILIVIIAAALWTAIIYYGAISGFLLTSRIGDDSTTSFINTTKAAIKKEFVGNFAMVLIENGEVADSYYYSIGKPVDQHTVFQMASISKWVTAWGIHALVEDGKIDLDKPIETYLSRWQLPESEFNNQGVTVRNILSHTAGFVDGLGYGGYLESDSIQTLEESLTKASDGHWSGAETRVGFQPNSWYKYSGGGYTLLQLLIEEVTGMSFNAYMTKTIFEPLKMTRSTFLWSDTLGTELATFYNADSTEAPHYRYTALAAASLYTTTEDLAKFVIAHTKANEVLSEETITAMRQSHMPAEYPEYPLTSKHALGPYIYGENSDGDIVFGHDGGNRNAINTTARLNIKTKDAIIAFESGSGGFASRLGQEWVFWNSGIAQWIVVEKNLPMLFTFLGLGYILIIFISIRQYRKRKAKIN